MKGLAINALNGTNNMKIEINVVNINTYVQTQLYFYLFL